MHISNIFWERVNVHIQLDEDIEGKNVFLGCKKKRIPVSCHGKEIIINVTNTPEGEMLDKGTYGLFCEHEEILVSPELLEGLDAASRIFKYSKGACAYLVIFSATEDRKLTLETSFMVENHRYKRYHATNESRSLLQKTKILGFAAYLKGLNFLYRVLRLFHFRKDKGVLFLTENSNCLNGNLKAAKEQWDVEKKAYVYAVNHYDGKGSVGKTISRTLRQISLMSKVNTIYVDNYETILTFVDISRKCRVIQLWHAGVGFKSVGYARFGLEGSPHPYCSGHRKYTDVYVDREELIPIYQEVFGCKRELFSVTGMPRLKDYMAPERMNTAVQRIYEAFPMLKDKKVILFAPTFRGVGSLDAYYDYDMLDTERIFHKCKERNAVFVVKMHPFVHIPMEIKEEYKTHLVDCSEWDINDLIYISDIMITDYSSCAYEFSLFHKPLIFYRYDKKIYEYFRPVHTLDVFSEDQYEVQTFEELLQVIDRLI